jgi:hypothetical protein
MEAFIEKSERPVKLYINDFLYSIFNSCKVLGEDFNYLAY